MCSRHDPNQPVLVTFRKGQLQVGKLSIPTLEFCVSTILVDWWKCYKLNSVTQLACLLLDFAGVQLGPLGTGCAQAELLV
jgi:hypothetical protein